MKKIAILIVLILSVSMANAQYNKWAVEVEAGTHQLNSSSSDSEGLDDGLHFGLAGRYNFNPKFGFGVVGGLDNLSVITDDGLNDFNLDYYRVNLEAYVNILKVLDLNPTIFTMLVHGGPGLSWIESDAGYNERVENISGGITGLFKVSNRLALKIDFTTTGNIGQTRTVDNLNDINNSGINSTMHNLSLGAVIYLGKKKENKLQPHADWYVAPKDTLTVVNNKYITENIYPITEINEEFFIDIIKNYNAVQPISEYVFFDHDEYEIRDTELNAIYKVYTELIKHDSYNLIIKGWASPTSSTDEYNKELSENRSNRLYNKFIDMGIDSLRIDFESYGKDFDKIPQNVHDVARRVELIVTK